VESKVFDFDGKIGPFTGCLPFEHDVAKILHSTKRCKENKMKTKLSFTVTSTILLLLSACGMVAVTGSGKVVNETRDVHGYSQVVFSAPGEMTIEQNGQEGLVIEADDNLLQYIKASVKGDILYIYVEPDILQLYPSKPIRYSLEAGTLTHVALNGSGIIRSNELIASNLDFDLNGSGDISIAAVKSQNTALVLGGSGTYRIDSLITDQFTASLNGSGDLVMNKVILNTANLEVAGSGKLSATNLVADSLSTNMSGSGDCILSGQVNQQSVAIYGSGSYNAEILQSQVTTVKIIGSGDSHVWATDELNVTIAGSGDIAYLGKPVVKQTVTGSGDITELGRQ
jgi:hypothetical protein